MKPQGHAALEVVFVAPLLILITLVFLGLVSLAVRQFALHQAARDVARYLAFAPNLTETDMQVIAQEKLARRIPRALSIKVHLRPVPVSVAYPMQRAPARVDIVELWVQYDVTFPGLDRAFPITAATREARVS